MLSHISPLWTQSHFCSLIKVLLWRRSETKLLVQSMAMCDTHMPITQSRNTLFCRSEKVNERIIAWITVSDSSQWPFQCKARIHIPAEFRPKFQILADFRSFLTGTVPCSLFHSVIPIHCRTVAIWRHDVTWNPKDVGVYPEERQLMSHGVPQCLSGSIWRHYP